MKWLISLALAFVTSGYLSDETVAGYGAADKVWVLTELDGAPFNALATLTFPKRDTIAGQGPCNQFSATMDTPHPWFNAGPLMSTKKACPDLQQEAAFFGALTEMSLSDVLGDVLILSNDAGREMVFRSDG